jgi:hypothetical protein
MLRLGFNFLGASVGKSGSVSASPTIIGEPREAGIPLISQPPNQCGAEQKRRDQADHSADFVLRFRAEDLIQVNRALSSPQFNDDGAVALAQRGILFDWSHLYHGIPANFIASQTAPEMEQTPMITATIIQNSSS